MARHISSVLLKMLIEFRIEAYCRGEISRFELVEDVIHILSQHGEDYMIEY